MSNIKLTDTDLEFLNNDKLFFPEHLLTKKLKPPESQSNNIINRPKNISIFRPLNNSMVHTLNLGVNNKINTNTNRKTNSNINFRLF